MEIFTSKGRGRPRKTLDVPVNASESAPNHSDSIGNGQSGNDGARTQENDARSFDQLVAKVKEASRSWKTNVCVAQHPNPDQDWIPTLTGWVRVIKGPAGYHLNSGEFVSL